MRRLLVGIVTVVALLMTSVATAGAAAKPDAPENLSISTGRGVAHLDWDDVSGAGGYNIYRNGKYLDTVTSDSAYRDRNRPNTYTYYVTAFDGSKSQFSTRSNEVRVDTRRASAATPVAAPAPAPTPATHETNNTNTSTNSGNSTSSNSSSSLAAPAITEVETRSGYMKLEFDEVDGAAGYNVYRNGRLLETINGSPYDDKNRANTYTYYITAFDRSKTVFSPRSNEITANTRITSNWSAQAGSQSGSSNNNQPAAAAPVAPRNLSHTSTSTSTTIRWAAAPGDVHGYNIYIDGDYVDTAVGRTSYTTPLAPGTHTVRVHTVLDDGRISSPSAEYRIDLDARDTGWIRATTKLPTDVAFSWGQAAHNPHGYNIYLDGEYVDTITNGTSHRMTVLPGSREFTVHTVAANGAISDGLTHKFNMPSPPRTGIRVSNDDALYTFRWDETPYPNSQYRFSLDGKVVNVSRNTSFAAVLTPGSHRIGVLVHTEDALWVIGERTINVAASPVNVSSGDSDNNGLIDFGDTDSGLNGSGPSGPANVNNATDDEPEASSDIEFIRDEAGNIVGVMTMSGVIHDDGTEVVTISTAMENENGVLEDTGSMVTTTRPDESASIIVHDEHGNVISSLVLDATDTDQNPMTQPDVQTGTMTNQHGAFTVEIPINPNEPIRFFDEDGNSVTEAEVLNGKPTKPPFTVEPMPEPGCSGADCPPERPSWIKPCADGGLDQAEGVGSCS